MPNEPDQELIDIFRRARAATARGDIDAAADAVLEASLYHGVVKGNMKAMGLYLIGSGAIDGVQQRKKMAQQIATETVRLVEGDAREPGPDSTDYDGRLEAAGK
tara:strand:+ start:2608 stop:2919 length:312 start_codon:yes stop_codon:yes gene_type:complete